MKFSQDTAEAGYSIHAYETGNITVTVPGGPEEKGLPKLLVLEKSFIISPNRLIDDWAPQQLSELTKDDLTMLGEFTPEVVLLGSGEQMRFPSPQLLSGLMSRGIGIEVMDSSAACRTYNILAGEGRSVVAAILIR